MFNSFKLNIKENGLKIWCLLRRNSYWIKWLATVARSFPERNTVFAFEEAIGYTSGNNGLIVGDKDGISTVCVALELANYIYA